MWVTFTQTTGSVRVRERSKYVCQRYYVSFLTFEMKGEVLRTVMIPSSLVYVSISSRMDFASFADPGLTVQAIEVVSKSSGKHCVVPSGLPAFISCQSGSF